MNSKIEQELSDNFLDFLKSAEDDLNKNRYNPAVSSYFKAIAILCDLRIYQKVGLLPKNHGERFLYLKMHFPPIYQILNTLFKDYTDSYSKRVSKENALVMKKNVEKIKSLIGFEEKNK